MKYTLRTVAGAMALFTLILCSAGCKKAPSDSQKLSTVPTVNEPNNPTTGNTTPTPSQPETASHWHCGLRISLPKTAAANPSQEDKNLFSFAYESITGTVRFGTLSQLGQGATSSLEYAQLMIEKYGADTTREGTSTNVAHYALRVDGDNRFMYILYTYKPADSDTTVCWLVEADCHKDDLQTMRQIVGCCGWDAQKIPQL